MVKKHIKWIIGIGLLLTVSAVTMQPFIFKKNRIEKLTNLELPSTIRIIDYKFGYSLYGIEPFYAKVEIDRKTYEGIKVNLRNDIDYNKYIYDEIIPYYNYPSLNFFRLFACHPCRRDCSMCRATDYTLRVLALRRDASGYTAALSQFFRTNKIIPHYLYLFFSFSFLAENSYYE
jgi:hypothetical protein